MKYLITGGYGFLGSTIVHELSDSVELIIIYDNISRKGSEDNYNSMNVYNNIVHINDDISNEYRVNDIVKKYKPDVILHLAGQVAMTTSIENPRLDFNTNVIGSFNILNAARKYVPDSIIVYSSTNKVYGDLRNYHYTELETRYVCDTKPKGFDENTRIDLKTPYGVSKGSADQYFLDFANIFNMRTVVLRHSTMYGNRQNSNVDQGWVGWFLLEALRVKKNIIDSVTVSGNGKQVRDILFASDCVELYKSVIINIDKISGQVLNIGGGIDNSISILELLSYYQKKLNVDITIQHIDRRISDQLVYISDISKAYRCLNWKPLVSVEEGLDDILSGYL